MAYCQCECGTYRYKEYRDLYGGRSKSCGCDRSEAVSKGNKARSSVKVGNIYGNLEVMEDLGFRLQSRGLRESWYRCKCHNCGNENYECNGNNLQSGAVTSCGCVSSRGENIIKQILTNNHVNFSTQYNFSDLRSDNGYVLKFDFAIFKNDELDCLIEFDGRQHYFGPDAKWSHSDSLETIQYRDNLKNEYCKSHNIKLKRIPYDKINEITIKNLLDDTFVI